MKQKISFILATLLLLFTIASCDNKSDNKSDNSPSKETESETETESESKEEKETETQSNACEHSYSEWTVKREPSCEDGGEKERKCVLCGFIDVEYTRAIGHKLKEEKTVPKDCTAPAYTHLSCENCDFSYNTDFLEQEHSFKKTVKLPLATKSGYTENICEKCGYSYISDTTQYSSICASPYGEQSTPLHKGLDLSNYNHSKDAQENYLPIDFEAIKAQGYDFVILKIGSSHSGKSAVFDTDYEGAKAAGLEVGGYYYTYSKTHYGNSNDARDVINWIKGKQFEYPIYYDLEDSYLEGLGKDEYTKNITCFIETLQENGYYGALYTNDNWLYNFLDTEKILASFDIWIANWDSENQVWSELYNTPPLSMWQVTDAQQVNGLETNGGKADLNFCYKDYSAIMKKWGLNGFEKEEQELPEQN